MAGAQPTSGRATHESFLSTDCPLTCIIVMTGMAKIAAMGQAHDKQFTQVILFNSYCKSLR